MTWQGNSRQALEDLRLGVGGMLEAVLKLSQRPTLDVERDQHLSRLLLNHGNVEEDRLVMWLQVQRLMCDQGIEPGVSSGC